jgi:hypothetical protein
LENLKKCEFSQQPLVYLIGGGELSIDSTKMETITEWTIPTTITKFRSFVGETQYLHKFIAYFTTVAAPLHAITSNGQSFKWGKNQHKAFNETKQKISQTSILILPKLHKPFEVETSASGYAKGEVLKQGGKLV